jgi:choline dehydrogenase-like flavoprotein
MAEVGGFVRAGDDLPAPDLQLHAIPALLSEDPPFGISLGVCLLVPRSRGEAFLANAEPGTKPHILHRYFAAEDDMRRMEVGLALLLELARKQPLEPFCSEPEQVPTSGAAEDMRAFIRRHVQTLYHPVAPARWARTTTPSSTPSCASEASRGCAWSTRRSCRPCRAGTPTRRPSPSPNVPPT